MLSSRNDAASRGAPARLTVPEASGAALDLPAQWQACGRVVFAPGGSRGGAGLRFRCRDGVRPGEVQDPQVAVLLAYGVAVAHG
jgi:hypothetical protein